MPVPLKRICRDEFPEKANPVVRSTIKSGCFEISIQKPCSEAPLSNPPSSMSGESFFLQRCQTLLASLSRSLEIRKSQNRSRSFSSQVSTFFFHGLDEGERGIGLLESMSASKRPGSCRRQHGAQPLPTLPRTVSLATGLFYIVRKVGKDKVIAFLKIKLIVKIVGKEQLLPFPCAD